MYMIFLVSAGTLEKHLFASHCTLEALDVCRTLAWLWEHFAHATGIRFMFVIGT